MRINRDSFIYFYSKYSPSCNTLMPVIYDIQQAASIQPINIDNYIIREKIRDKHLFQSVPAILLNYPDENRVEIYEGQDVLSLLDKVCQLLGKPSIDQILNQYTSPSVPSMRHSTPAPSSSSSRGRGKTSLSFGDPSDMAVKIDDPFKEQAHLKELAETEPSENFRNMYAERMTMSTDIKKGEGHEGLPNSSLKQSPAEDNDIPSKGITTLSFDASSSSEDDDSGSLLMKPSDVSKADMAGSANSSSSRELEAKQKRINSAAQDMMRERDELDQSFNKKR